VKASRLTCLTAATVLAFLVAACGAPATAKAKQGDADRIVVASKSFGEGYLLGWMAALVIRDAGLQVDDGKIGMGATELLYPALKQGSIDVYPEYDGTLRTVILKKADVERDREKIYDETVKGIMEKDGVAAVGPLGFNNSFATSMTVEKSAALGISKLSDLVKHPELSLIGDATTWTRGDVYLGMADFYGIKLKKGPMVDTNFFYEALRQGQGDLITAFSTDGKLKKYGLRVLEDDKGYYPWYDALFLVNGDTMKKRPELGEALSRLVNRIDEETMTSLNEKVDVEKEDPRTVAADWLRSQGLIKN
jgi:glycine betaine/choline ABC-type transport system substrate-binding protein